MKRSITLFAIIFVLIAGAAWAQDTARQPAPCISNAQAMPPCACNKTGMGMGQQIAPCCCAQGCLCQQQRIIGGGMGMMMQNMGGGMGAPGMMAGGMMQGRERQMMMRRNMMAIIAGGVPPGMGMGEVSPAMRQYLADPGIQKFLDDTKDQRRELYIKRFDYFEALRNPYTPPADLQKSRDDIKKLQTDLYMESPFFLGPE